MKKGYMGEMRTHIQGAIGLSGQWYTSILSSITMNL